MADLGFIANDWPTISRRLDEALSLAPAQRDAWLGTLGEPEAIKDKLRRLLGDPAAVETADFLCNLPRLTLAASDLASGGAADGAQAGAVIGPYRLIRLLGVGGMGQVWLAERADGLLERQVALKLPHLSWGAASFADRMARERNILASLAHPNIARLYDAGLAADGRPYLALEYVDGQFIDAYVTAGKLGVRERVELIVQVARAVAHAHARLVVHRDLKPSNILVDARGQAHLLDFGIAKLVDPQIGDEPQASQLTQAPGRALTPDYASPEQIRGDPIGTASDIYSLGVVLFELLTGERPYRLNGGLGAAALADAIEHASVPRASTTSGAMADAATRRQLAGDLDAILARALAKASVERYATMAALADDLERHLRGEPVHARPPSRWYLTERWVRRHKLEAAVGAAVIVAVPAGAAAQAAVLTAIAAGAGVALWQMRRARQQAQAALAEAARAAAVKDFLTSFFKSGSLDEDGGAQLGRLSVQQFVERGARKIGAGFEHQPAVKAELLDVVSKLFADLSDGAATTEYARQWLRVLDQFGATEIERARATQRLAQGLALLGQQAQAAGLLARGVAQLGARGGAAGAPVLAHLLVDLARLRSELGDTPKALAGVNDALALLGPHDQGKPAAAATQATASATATAAAYAEAQFLRAELTALDNRLAAAVPLFEEAIARLERLHGERSVAVARHRFIYATALTAGRDDVLAEREFRHALLIFREAGGQGDLSAAIVELQLGRRIAIGGLARAEAMALLANARTVFAARAGDVSPIHAAQANLYLAEALMDDGDFERAREPMQVAAALFRDKVESAHQRTLAQLIQARFLSECGDYEGADRLLQQTLAERSSMLGPKHPLTASVTNRIGLNHLRRLDFVRAQAAFNDVLESQDRGDEAGVSIKQMARMNLAVALLDSGDVSLALPALETHLDHCQALPESMRTPLYDAACSGHLGRAYLLAGEPSRGLPLLQRSVDGLAPLHPKSPGLASNRCWLALCLLALGDEAQARALAELAREALVAQPSTGIHYRRSYALLCERLAATAPNSASLRKSS